MGLTETGFHRRTYDEILRGKISRAEELFGSDIDTSEQTPLGKFIRIGAFDQALAEQEIEDLYYSIFPDTATGVNLDRLCTFVGISRTPATPARFSIALHGTAGTQIPYGFLVETDAKIRYYNTAAAELDANGDATITVDCETAGVIGNVAAGKICIISNPVSGLSVVSGSNELIYSGTEAEDDVSLRARFASARSGTGSGNTNAIRAALMRVPTVTGVSILINESDEAIEDGGSEYPPHSFECCVSGGEYYYDQIAAAIFEKKPIGIATSGDIERTVTDEAGCDHTIRFSAAEEFSVNVQMRIRTDDVFTGTAGMNEIREAIRSYINGLPIGGAVVLSVLFAKIHGVTGVTEVTEVNLKKEGASSWSASNVSATTKQKAICGEIEITEVS